MSYTGTLPVLQVSLFNIYSKVGTGNFFYNMQYLLSSVLIFWANHNFYHVPSEFWIEMQGLNAGWVCNMVLLRFFKLIFIEFFFIKVMLCSHHVEIEY
jgi:hypothetical protein